MENVRSSEVGQSPEGRFRDIAIRLKRWEESHSDNEHFSEFGIARCQHDQVTPKWPWGKKINTVTYNFTRHLDNPQEKLPRGWKHQDFRHVNVSRASKRKGVSESLWVINNVDDGTQSILYAKLLTKEPDQAVLKIDLNNNMPYVDAEESTTTVLAGGYWSSGGGGFQKGFKEIIGMGDPLAKDFQEVDVFDQAESILSGLEASKFVPN